MTVVGDDTIPRARSSFAVSGCLHGCVLAWVILAGSGQTQPWARNRARERAQSIYAQSIYDQEIRPNEKKIVWYSLREKLPEIAPAEARPDTRPARAGVRAPQTMVAGARDDARTAPLIWAPEPEVVMPKEIPLPNVVAVAAPKVVRAFVAPPVKVAAVRVAEPLPDAPRVAEAIGVPEARRVTAAALIGAPAPSGPARAFTPPPSVRMQRQAMVQLPEGPQPAMVVEANALPFPDAGPRPPPRAFVAPPAKLRAVAAAGLAVEPEVAGVQGGMAAASLAIVGLNPAKTAEVPAPPVSRAAGFSAGPEAREGGTGANKIALLNVPGLVVQGGAKDVPHTLPHTLVASFSPTSRENLLAAARMGAASRVTVEPRAPRVSGAPDARFAGRVVYSIAIQMPNVTSFSGSWLVWFAERDPAAGGGTGQMQAPVVVRKVDPKYIAAAAAERVEGTVRLFGAIGKDGHVGGILLLRQLDERLDRSAQEALAKWEFVPAKRGGVAVDVDAIFEIPFHLAPRVN